MNSRRVWTWDTQYVYIYIYIHRIYSPRQCNAEHDHQAVDLGVSAFRQTNVANPWFHLIEFHALGAYRKICISTNDSVWLLNLCLSHNSLKIGCVLMGPLVAPFAVLLGQWSQKAIKRLFDGRWAKSKTMSTGWIGRSMGKCVPNRIWMNMTLFCSWILGLIGVSQRVCFWDGSTLECSLCSPCPLQCGEEHQYCLLVFGSAPVVHKTMTSCEHPKHR